MSRGLYEQAHNFLPFPALPKVTNDIPNSGGFINLCPWGKKMRSTLLLTRYRHMSPTKTCVVLSYWDLWDACLPSMTVPILTDMGITLAKWLSYQKFCSYFHSSIYVKLKRFTPASLWLLQKREIFDLTLNTICQRLINLFTLIIECSFILHP